jgi:hypothetical protein
MADVAEKKDKKSAPEVEERLPRSLLFDLGESVPFWAILGGLLWFNNSAKGKSFYNALWKAHPTDEDLAGKMYRGITGAVSAPIFFGFILFYTFIDFAKPKLLYDTRIQPRPPPGWKAYAKTLFWVMLYQTLITGPLSKVYFAIWKKRGGTKTIRTIPSPLRTILEFLSLEAAFEVGFYLSHRLVGCPAVFDRIKLTDVSLDQMHTKFMYRWHKQHRKYSLCSQLQSLSNFLIRQTRTATPLPSPPRTLTQSNKSSATQFHSACLLR